jgi:hypothetical protein
VRLGARGWSKQVGSISYPFSLHAEAPESGVNLPAYLAAGLSRSGISCFENVNGFQQCKSPQDVPNCRRIYQYDGFHNWHG